MQPRTLLIAAIVAAALLAVTLAAPAAAAERSWEEVYGATAGTLRTVGVALFGWYFEEHREAVEIEGREELDVAALQAATVQQLEAWLVPGRLESVPTTDAWGNPLDVRVDLAAEGEPFFLIRSAGPDGEWDGDVYAAGGVTPGGEGDDLVWADGYFVRWPQPAGG